MLDLSGSLRLWITAGFLLGSTAFIHNLHHGESVVPRRPLSELPYFLGTWTGEERPLQARIVQAVSVSDYTNRVYVDQAAPPIQLYIGYYSSQRTGDSIHSPKNCLPGAGWAPVRSGYTTISIPGAHEIEVNEYVIQQDLNKQMVFYWYQSRGRVIASEYQAKFWMVADAISRNRTDAALVRIITPMNDGDAIARARLVRFTQLLFQNLDGILPN